MATRTYIRVFRNAEKLNEMLELARLGWTYKSLGERYGADHSSIIYQCKKVGISHAGMQIRKGRGVKEVESVAVLKKKEPTEIEKMIIEPVSHGLASYRDYLNEDRKRNMSKVDKLLLEIRRK